MTTQQTLDRMTAKSQELHNRVDELVSTVCMLNLIDRQKHLTAIRVIEDEIEKVSGMILQNDAEIRKVMTR